MPDLEVQTTSVPNKWMAMGRGLRMRCPHCDSAPLFRAYLKQVDHCEACGQAWGDVRADDGPAWATMLIVGHVLALVFHIIIFRMGLPVWGAVGVLCAVATVMTLVLLPRVKGATIGLIWALDAPTS